MGDGLLRGLNGNYLPPKHLILSIEHTVPTTIEIFAMKSHHAADNKS